MKISEKYQGERFQFLLFTAVQKFLNEHLDAVREDKKIE